MKKTGRLVILVFFSLLFLVWSNAVAGEWLNKQEVSDLLSGNTVKGFYMKQKESLLTGQVGLQIKFFRDGKAEKTTSRTSARDGDFTEHGKWFVNKKGRLCMIWQPENKKKCGRMKKSSDGTYELIRKNQKFVYQEIIPGT